MPNDLLTIMLQRTIMGLECYISAAVEYELSKCGHLTTVFEKAIKNPFSLDRKAVVAIYEKLPALVNESLKLSVCDSLTYTEIATLYKELRNPIFHGGQVAFSGDNFDGVVSAFEVFSRVYDWIDSWYTAFPLGWQRNS